MWRARCRAHGWPRKGPPSRGCGTPSESQIYSNLPERYRLAHCNILGRGESRARRRFPPAATAARGSSYRVHSGLPGRAAVRSDELMTATWDGHLIHPEGAKRPEEGVPEARREVADAAGAAAGCALARRRRCAASPPDGAVTGGSGDSGAVPGVPSGRERGSNSIAGGGFSCCLAHDFRASRDPRDSPP
jgi:hypothetical protein